MNTLNITSQCEFFFQLLVLGLCQLIKTCMVGMVMNTNTCNFETKEKQNREITCFTTHIVTCNQSLKYFAQLIRKHVLLMTK